MDISISNIVNSIKTAIYGQDVRKAIADGIQNISDRQNVADQSEVTRQSNEQERNDNEVARSTAESSRVQAEQSRVTAETQREADVNVIKTAYDAATKANTNVELTNARHDNINNIDYQNVGARMDALASQSVDITTNKLPLKANQTDLNTANTNIANNTANISTLQNQMVGAVSGSPIPATLASQMIDHTRNYVYLGTESGYTSGNLYYWNGSSFVNSGKQYQSTGIAEKSINESLLTFIPFQTNNSGTNMFNKRLALSGQYVRQADGTLGTNASYAVSYYIEIVGGDQYTVNYMNQTAFYDANKTYISGIADPGNIQYTFTAPSNAKYVRLTMLLTNLNVFQIVHGTTIPDYIPFNGDVAYVDLNKDVKTMLDQSIKGTIINLFDKTKATDGQYVSYNTGVLNANASYSASDFIPVNEGEKYTINIHNQTAYYDGNKVYKSGVSVVATTYTYTIPAGVKYLRFSMLTSNKDLIQFQKGEVVTPYESYGYKVPYNTLSVEILNKISTQYKAIFSIMNQIVLSSTTKKIKLIGDSITHGQGGTGFAQDGAAIGTTGKYVNTQGYCWANLLKKYLTARYNCVVNNWGTSGFNSSDILTYFNQLVQSDDDIVICMIGTNDRIINAANNSKDKLYNNLKAIINNVHNMGKEIIIMSSVPATNEDNPVYAFRMDDVDSVIMKVTSDMNIEYISLFKKCIEYCVIKGISPNDLLADQLHPNDIGHKLMFQWVCDRLGIGRAYDYDPVYPLT